MTMSPGDPGPTDFEGKTLPPNVCGATGPVESDEQKAPERGEDVGGGAV